MSGVVLALSGAVVCDGGAWRLRDDTDVKSFKDASDRCTM